MYRLVLCLILMGWLSASDLKISAAANLKMVLEEVKQEFLKDYPNDEIVITYLASGAAYAQIKSGLEVDVFLSADTQKPEQLFKEGFGLYPPEIYALGKLVLCTTEDLNLSTDQILASPQVKHIAIANPKLAPYGEASVEFLKKIKLYEKVQEKLVLGHSLGQSLSYVKSKAAEVGLSALSLVKFDSSMSYRIIDSKLYSPIKQSLIILKASKNQALAEAFVRFVMSAKGQEIFEKFGYERQ